MPSPEAIAHFDERFECHAPRTTRVSAAFIDRICSATRAENRAAAAQLVALGELFAYRWSRCGGREEWVMDTMAAVAAEVAAALRISQGLAASRLRYARAMRERLPKTAEVFSAGDIGYLMFATIVPCGGLGRVVAHSGPGGVAAGRARTLRPGRAMSGAGKLDGARHARCKNPMDRTECRARPRRLPSRCLPSHPRYPQRLGLPGAGRVAMVVSKVCSIRCGGACLHRRRSLILMSGLNAMLRGPRGCRRRSSIGSARRLGPKTGPLRRSWWRWGSCSPIGGRVAGAARSG
ncbi:Conserved protein of uncharacterised function (13E12 repeat family protein) [Mycobacterium tuberculosis]|nr:Conserved protein of uncharacterised function (13E12 repeat family protein) [Mycobacterium tuberculosis]